MQKRAPAHLLAIHDSVDERSGRVPEERLLPRRLDVAREGIALHHAPGALLIRRDSRMAFSAQESQISQAIISSVVHSYDVIKLSSVVAAHHTHPCVTPVDLSPGGMRYRDLFGYLQ